MKHMVKKKSTQSVSETQELTGLGFVVSCYIATTESCCLSTTPGRGKLKIFFFFGG